MNYFLQENSTPSAESAKESDLSFLQETAAKLQESFSKMFDSAVNMIPKVIVFICILIVGRIIAGIIRKVILKALQTIHFDEMLTKAKMDVMLNKIKPGLKASLIIGKMLFWIIMLTFITAAAEYIGLNMITDGIAAFFAYLPTLFCAILLIFIGLYIAEMVKNVVYSAANSIGVSGAKAIANIVYYLLAIVVVITGLGQAGLETHLIETNLHLIIGSILLAFAISYGLASREVTTNLLSSYYGKGKFKPGMKIRIDGKEGVVERIDGVSITLNQGDSSIVLPAKQLIEKEIEILSS